MDLFAKKSVAQLLDEMAGENRLRRVLGPLQLTSLGIGCIIGSGIFVVIGKVAHDTTGPALMLSFVVAALACIFSALCYAEFASLVPVAGSAYTYAYATLGELMAWIIGWDLVLEYTVASASVAHGWSKYFQNFIEFFGIQIPHFLSNTPYDFIHKTAANADGLHGFIATGSWFDLPAVAVSLVLTVILVIGIRESARFNTAMVAVKLAVVLFVIVVGAFYIDPANWVPFAPYGWSGFQILGHPIGGLGGHPVGMLAGASMIFYAYIGFDSVSTHAEEARHPRRDVPIGIIASLLVCTVLYIAMAAVLTGMVPYDQIDVDAPVAVAFKQRGLHYSELLISIGAVTGITSVLMVLMLSQPRVLLAMARDGLIPPSFFGVVHPHFKTPWKSTILTGALVSAMAGLLPLSILLELVNIGTLLAFVIVCAAVLVLRHTHPDAERPFRVPLMPWLPILGILFCLLLMFSLPWANWLRLLIWLALGMLIYFAYGYRHSVLRRAARRAARRGGA